MTDMKIKQMSLLQYLLKYGLIILVILMCIFLSFFSPVFLSPANLINICRQISINGIIAVGMTFILLSGCIDISVGAIVAVSGVVCGSILVNDPNAVLFACVASIAICMAFGWVSGFMVSSFGIPPMIATLAMMTIARGFALVYADGRPYLIQSDSFAVIGQGDIGFLPVPTLVLILVLIIFQVLLSNTAFGRSVYALGGNRKAAEASGVNCKRVLRMVFSISGALAGVAGLVLASRIGSGQPAIGQGYEMDAIAACVIGGASTMGGIGKLSGTVVGVFIIGLISNALTLLNVDVYWQQIVKGLIIAVAVILDVYTKQKSK